MISPLVVASVSQHLECFLTVSTCVSLLTTASVLTQYVILHGWLERKPLSTVGTQKWLCMRIPVPLKITDPIKTAFAANIASQAADSIAIM